MKISPPLRLCVSALLLATAFLEGCGGGRWVRVSEPRAGAAGPPRIERLVDLGALPQPAEGPISRAASDGRFTPGERVAVVGDNLHPAPEVTIDALPVALEGWLQGGALLVTLPRNLNPAEPHRLHVRTPSGAAETEFDVSAYAVAADPGEGALHFVRLAREARLLVDDETTSIGLRGASVLAVSPSGGLVCAAGTARARRGVSGADLRVVHLGAKGGPAEVGALRIPLSSSPAAVEFVAPDRVALLGSAELVLVDVSVPGRPTEIGRVSLRGTSGPPRFRVLGVVADGVAVALDGSRGRLTALDLSVPCSPRITAELDLDTPEGFSAIDLAVRGPEGIFVLEGGGASNAYASVPRLARGAIRFAEGFLRGALGQPPPPEPPDTPLRRPRLVRVILRGGALSAERAVEVPESFYPAFAALVGGEVTVGGVGWGIGEEEAEAGASLVGQALRALASPLRFGRVYRLGADGRFVCAFRGTALYLDASGAAGGATAYLALKLTPSVSSFVEPSWGVGVVGRGFVGLRDWEVDSPRVALSAGNVVAQ